MEHAGNVRIESMIGDFFKEHQHRMEHYEADKIDEVVYSNKVIDPLGTEAHTFYGVFEVISLLSRKWAGIPA
jgi:predicted Ser/Thr protein kinase